MFRAETHENHQGGNLILSLILVPLLMTHLYRRLAGLLGGDVGKTGQLIASCPHSLAVPKSVHHPWRSGLKIMFVKIVKRYLNFGSSPL